MMIWLPQVAVAIDGNRPAVSNRGYFRFVFRTGVYASLCVKGNYLNSGCEFHAIVSRLQNSLLLIVADTTEKLHNIILPA